MWFADWRSYGSSTRAAESIVEWGARRVAVDRDVGRIMVTEEEKRDLVERSRDSFKRVQEASRQAIDSSQRAAAATQRSIDVMSKYGEEMGRRASPAREIIEHLTSKGRTSELAEFLRIIRVDEHAGQEAEDASAEAELAWARATPEQKLPLVLSVLRGEGSVAEIGRRHRVSDVTLAKWRDAFLAGGAAALGNEPPARAVRWSGGGAGSRARGDQGGAR